MTSTSLKAGDEIEVDGKVYVVALNASKILIGDGDCVGCYAHVNSERCMDLSERDKFGIPYCRLDRHLIFKLKGDNDVQDENADDRQVSLTEERQPTDMG